MISARGAGELQEFLARVEDLGREGFPISTRPGPRTELQFRECIRRTFGEKSHEFQEHRHHRLLMGSPEETRQSIALIKSLIATLEQKKLDLQGGPPPQQIPATPPGSTSAEAPTDDRSAGIDLNGSDDHDTNGPDYPTRRWPWLLL